MGHAIAVIRAACGLRQEKKGACHPPKTTLVSQAVLDNGFDDIYEGRESVVVEAGVLQLYVGGAQPSSSGVGAAARTTSGPVHSTFRVPLFAARTLNATGQARVPLSLR